jgi:hypothetical protein
LLRMSWPVGRMYLLVQKGDHLDHGLHKMQQVCNLTLPSKSRLG